MYEVTTRGRHPESTILTPEPIAVGSCTTCLQGCFGIRWYCDRKITANLVVVCGRGQPSSLTYCLPSSSPLGWDGVLFFLLVLVAAYIRTIWKAITKMLYLRKIKNASSGEGSVWHRYKYGQLQGNLFRNISNNKIRIYNFKILFPTKL